MIFRPERFQAQNILLYFSITIIVSIATLLIYRSVNINTYKKALSILGLLFIIVPTVSSIFSGANALFSYLIIITGILAIAIVYNFKITAYYTVFCCLVLLLILLIQNLSPSSNDNKDITIGSMVVSFAFILVIVNIVKIGFLQIEKYYAKSLDYLQQLEETNRELDNKVKERTKKIQDDFQKQVDSLYKSATIGDITKPLLHDLATPISVFDGSLNMLKRQKKYDAELVDALIDSTEQIKLLLSETRDLMRGNDVLQVFEANTYVQKVVKLLNNEFKKYEIDFSFRKTSEAYINGYSGLFERLIINIIVNSIEELKSKTENRKIDIEVKIEEKNLLVEITDNGHGINKEFADKIFSENFSLKHSDHNLGLGLPFVKKMIKEKFNGDITFESEENKYTKFILIFELYEGKVPKDSGK